MSEERLPLHRTMRLKGQPVKGKAAAVDIDNLRITRKAVISFQESHPQEEDPGSALQDTLDELINSGIYYETEEGFHVYRAQGYEVVLSPEFDALTGYRSLRALTLLDLRDGVGRPPALHRTFGMKGAPIPGPPGEVDVDTLDISRRAVESFVKAHDYSEEDARAALLDTLDELLSSGLYFETDRGYCLYIAQGCQVLLNPKRDTIVDYDTAQKNYTLVEIRDGVHIKKMHEPVAGLDVLKRIKPKNLYIVHTVWDEHRSKFSSPKAFRNELKAAVQEAVDTKDILTQEDGSHIVSGKKWRVFYTPSLQHIIKVEPIDAD